VETNVAKERFSTKDRRVTLKAVVVPSQREEDWRTLLEDGERENGVTGTAVKSSNTEIPDRSIVSCVLR